MKTIAVSACLLGEKCRFDGKMKQNDTLIDMLDGHRLILFCPEDSCFGTPRPSMDLVQADNGDISAICNETHADLTSPIHAYAMDFFEQNRDIDIYIGKDRSPSCGVNSSKVYDEDGLLLSEYGTGTMSSVAQRAVREIFDAEEFISSHLLDHMAKKIN